MKPDTTETYSFAIYRSGRHVDDLGAGEYATEAEAQVAAQDALDMCCPEASPARKFYRIEII